MSIYFPAFGQYASIQDKVMPDLRHLVLLNAVHERSDDQIKDTAPAHGTVRVAVCSCLCTCTSVSVSVSEVVR